MIELRPANCKDLALFWDLRTRSVAHACASHYSAPVLAAWLAAPAPASLQQHVADGGGTVAIEDGRLLGYAVLDTASGEIDAVFVEPAQQGRGVGAMLMRRLEAAALAAGHKRLFLSASLNAVAFYARAGFVAVREEIYHHRSGIAIPSVYMEKHLNR